MKTDRTKVAAALVSAAVVGASVTVWAAASAQDMKEPTGRQQKSEVIINGEAQDVPESGDIHKTVVNEHGTTIVDIHTENSGTNTTSTQSLDVTVESSSTE